MQLALAVEIERPVSEVFAYWADLERASEWAAPVIERRKLTDGAVGVGTRFRAVDRFPGQRVEFDLEITAYEPDEHMSAVWSKPMEGGWDATFTEIERGTRLTMQAEMRPSGLMRLLSPIMGPWAKRQMRKDLQAFKQRLEEG